MAITRKFGFLRTLLTLIVCLAVISGCSQTEDQTEIGARSDTDIAQSTSPEEQQTAPEPAAEESPQDNTASESADKPIDSQPEAPAIDPSQAEEISQCLVQLAVGAEIERRAAVESLSNPDRATFDYIVIRLTDGQLNEQQGAAKYLIGRVGPNDTAAAEALTAALKAKDDVLRHSAVQAMERLPADQLSAALPGLLEMLDNEQEDEAYIVRIIRAISGLGTAGESATATLAKVGKQHTSLNARRAAFAAIQKIAGPKEAEEFFIDVLDTDIPTDLRRLAVMRLGRTARSDTALNVLLKQLETPEKEIAKAASLAFVDIGRPAVPALIKGLESQVVQVRKYSAFALGKIGPLATDAIPALEKCENDPNEDVCKLAAAALHLIKRR